MNANVEVTHYDLNDLVVYAFRYCIDRSSYALSDGIRLVKTYWTLLNSGSRDCIKRDLKREIEKQQDKTLSNATEKALKVELLEWIENDSSKPQSSTPTPLNPMIKIPVVDQWKVNNGK